VTAPDDIQIFDGRKIRQADTGHLRARVQKLVKVQIEVCRYAPPLPQIFLHPACCAQRLAGTETTGQSIRRH
jgi:hypothetical protein